MIQLETLWAEDFEAVYRIMEESFPPEERRTKEGQKELLFEEKYELLGIKKEKELLAFLAVWHFTDFTFVEHFAVEQNARNGGLGAQILEALLRREKKKVVLEVELPESDLEQRRIAFYERNGFCLNDYSYIQPPMTEYTHAIPLKIMSAPEKISEKEFRAIRSELYRYVYHYTYTE